MYVSVSNIMLFITPFVFAKRHDIRDSEVLKDSIGMMASEIMLRDFKQCHCIGIITENSDLINYVPLTFERSHIQIGSNLILELEESTTLDSNALSNATKTFEKFLLKTLDEGCLGYIIQVSNPVAVVHSFSRASRRATYRANRQYLYLPLPDSFPTSNGNIFATKAMNYMPDIVFASVVLSNTSLVHTCYQNHERNCGNLQLQNSKSQFERFSEESTEFYIELYTQKFKGINPAASVLLDVWSVDEKQFLLNVNLYSDKTANVEGKQLTLITGYYPPFNIFDLNKRPPLYDGIEFRVLLEFQRSINFTFREEQFWLVWGAWRAGSGTVLRLDIRTYLLLFDPENYWGETFENGTGNGVLGTVAEDKADIGFLAYYSWPRAYKWVDFAMPHMRSSVTVMTPRPKLLPGWLAPLLPFTGTVWTAVLLSVAVCIFILYWIQIIADKYLGTHDEPKTPFSDLGETALFTIGMIVLQPADFYWETQYPAHTPSRHFVSWFHIAALLIAASYAGGLASVLAVPRYEKPIETIPDLAHHNVLWGANHISWIWSVQEDEDPDLQKITSNFCLLTEEQMIKIGRESGVMAFGIERLQGGHFTTEPHITEETVAHRRIMKGTLYWSHLIFLWRKGSPYKHRFNKMVSRIREAGLPLFWEGEVIRLYMSSRLQLAITRSKILNQNPGARKLKVDRLQGAFFLFLLGHALAFISFIMELLLARCCGYQISVREGNYRGHHIRG